MKICVKDHKGKDHQIDATLGWTLMEAIKKSNLSFKAECGGALACATCHVYVDEDWFRQLPKRSETEEELLDLAFEVQDNSRLSCQITLEPALEGISVTLAPGTEPE